MGKLEETAKRLAAASRLEFELLAKEHASKAADTGIKAEKKAICIDLTALLNEEAPPIEIQFGDLLEGLDGELSPEETEEKEKLTKSFGMEAGAAARKQFEPMLLYLKQQAQLQQAFRDRAAKRRRGEDGTPATAPNSAERACTKDGAKSVPTADDGKDAADEAEAKRIVQKLRAAYEKPTPDDPA